MISQEERLIYEKMQMPFVLFEVSNGNARAELISDGLCGVGNKERDIFLEQLNRDIYLQVHPQDKAWIKREFDNFLHKTNGFDVVYRNKIQNLGGYRMVHAIGNWQKMKDGTEMACIAYYDMLDPMGKMAKLFSPPVKDESDLLFTDVVTGLPNLAYLRQFSNERLQIIRSCQKQPVVIYIDVKSLHDYNVQYGYHMGDELMRLYAGLFKDMFPNALITRAADDQFVIIDEYENDDLITKKIDEINSRSKHMAYGKTHGIHVGICKVESAMDSAIAVDYARLTMKEIGDDLSTVWKFHSEDQKEKHWKERYILENLETALENKWIVPFYQAILRTSSGKLTILESLARWIDPVCGEFYPDQFIPVYARYHMMHKLDLYMVEQVCIDINKRKGTEVPVTPVTVNFSAQDCDYVDLADELNRILEKYDVDHEYIIVEITEQDLALSTEYFKEQLKKIRDNGYQLWIDDFGSGYSSLSVFSQYSIDRIKFDMDLLRHWNDNSGANRSILKAFTGVCRELGVGTLAEGVETEEQYEFLKEIDCDLAQGYYLHKPESLEATIFKYKSFGSYVDFETMEERKERSISWRKIGETNDKSSGL